MLGRELLDRAIAQLPAAPCTTPRATMMTTGVPIAEASAGHDPGRVEPDVEVDEPEPADETALRKTVLDASLDDALAARPAMPALDMRLQPDTVHARSFGRPAEEHRIGRYLVHGTLGQGGMGKVLRAHDETLGRDVALKVLHDGRGGSHEQRLLREAQALARLAHPNVVCVYDVDDIDGRLCMAMELVQGTPLHEWQREPRPWPDVLDVYHQAGRGLAAAHAEGLVHRDFKPANCILDGQGTVKVLDFGLARGVGTEPEVAVAEVERTHTGTSHNDDDSVRASRSQRMLEQVLTRTGAMLGTLAYMAPEQLMGKPADPSSDQFAFCVALYEALYGTRPFSGTTAMALLYAIQSEPPAFGRGRPGLPLVPKWLHDVLRRGLSVASHQRYPDMTALLAALERGLARRRRLRGAALGGVLLAGFGGALALGGVLQGERPCEGLREQPMPAWTEGDRQSVGDAIAATGLPEATRVRERVEDQLDAYAHAWAEARADACEATWVHHEAGEQALARRMACLDERVVHVRAVVEQLGQADTRAAAFATATVDALPALAPCADVEALLRGPAPVPAALAGEAAEIRGLIARSWVSGASGDEVRGVEAADQAVTAAEALAQAPVLRLEALYNRGHLLRMARYWSQARRDLEAALALAEQLDDDTRAIDVLSELVLLADDADDVAVAAAWFAAIAGKLARLEHEPRRAAQRWWLEGVVAIGARRLDQAVAAAEHAVTLYAKLDPPAEAEQLEALILLGDARRRHGDMVGAEEAFARAVALAQQEGHLPVVARVLYKQGHLHYVQGRLAAALPLIERAVALRDLFYGPRAAASIRSRLLLSIILQVQGALPQAIAQAALARESLDDRVPAQLRGEVHKQLARLHRAHERWSDAIASYREARSAWQAVPVPDRVELAKLDNDIADCLVLAGEPHTARALYDGVLAVLAVETPPDDPLRAYPLLGRGQLLLAQGEREAGIASLRAALALAPKREEDPTLYAELRWVLGRALRPATGEAPQALGEAVALVRDAREVLAEAGQTKRVAEIDAWLASTIPHATNTDHEPRATKQ
jgi:eukaryotic-like serine/threonine-protein kinase